MIFGNITINYGFNGVGYTLSIVAGDNQNLPYDIAEARLSTVLSKIRAQTYESLSRNFRSIFHPNIPMAMNKDFTNQ